MLDKVGEHIKQNEEGLKDKAKMDAQDERHEEKESDSDDDDSKQIFIT